MSVRLEHSSYYLRLCVQLATFSPSSKLSAVVHVGLVNGVVHDTSQTGQQEPLKYELQGSVLDLCRQILTTETVVGETEPYTIKVTSDALDDDGRGGSLESMRLVPDSTCFTVCNGDSCFILVCLKVRLLILL